MPPRLNNICGCQEEPLVPDAAKTEADTTQKQTAAAQPSQAEVGSKAQPSKLAKGSQNADGGAQQAGARDSSKTVFVRALPADASQDQLHLAFSKFGKLRSCRFATLSLQSCVHCFCNFVIP